MVAQAAVTLPAAEEMMEEREVSDLGLIPRLEARREAGRREREEKSRRGMP